MKMNKHGMTLVECIIAMGVFAVATTGFIMTATACYKAQTKAKSRMENANTQTTNLEHFSNYSEIVDPEALNVEAMNGGANRWVITFPFSSASGGPVTNTHVHGYYSVADPTDPAYDLSFFSPIEQVDLTTDEYWVSLTNISGSDGWFELRVEDATKYEFFDVEKAPKGTELPEHIWGANGGCYRFGIKNIAGNISNAVLVVHDVNIDSDIAHLPLDHYLDDPSDATKGYCSIFYNGGSGNSAFLNQAEADALP